MMDHHSRSQMVLWGIMAFCYGVLLIVLAGPFKPELDVQLTGYKVGHFGAFAVLGLLIAYYFRREFAFSVVLGLTLTLLACVFFGGLLEWYQCLVPGRSPELRDITLDATGAFAGALAYGLHRISAGGRLSKVTANSGPTVESMLELLERR